jgi:hypothetical protein
VTHYPRGLGQPGLPQVFTPAAAAEVLRAHGLTTITECALKARAYRKQVPFHLNGRRVVFTLADLAEIVEGQARRPEPRPAALAVRTSAPRPSPHRSACGCTEPAEPWRARRPHRPSRSPERHS